MASLHSMSGTDLADVARLAAAGDPESFAVLVRATQADVARALRAAKQTGAGCVDVMPDGTIRISLSPSSTGQEDRRAIEPRKEIIL